MPEGGDIYPGKKCIPTQVAPPATWRTLCLRVPTEPYSPSRWTERTRPGHHGEAAGGRAVEAPGERLERARAASARAPGRAAAARAPSRSEPAHGPGRGTARADAKRHGVDGATVPGIDTARADPHGADAAAAGAKEDKLRSPSPRRNTGVPRELLGLALVACSAVCFSVVATLVKFETRQGLSSMEAIFWRSAGAFVLNAIAMLARRVHPRVPSEARGAMALQCVFGFACTAFAFYAISRMVLADASVLIFLSPVLTIFFGALFLNERIDRVSLGCALFSIVGVICVVRPSIFFGELSDNDANHNARAPTLAVLSALLAAVTQALLYVSVRRLQSVHSLVVAHYFALSSAVIAMLCVCVFQSNITWPSTMELQLAAAGTGVFAFVGQVALTKGFQLEHAGVAAVMRYLDVVCVFVWDSVFLEESVSVWSVVGAVIVCSCALVCALRKARTARAQTLAPPEMNVV